MLVAAAAAALRWRWISTPLHPQFGLRGWVTTTLNGAGHMPPASQICFEAADAQLQLPSLTRLQAGALSCEGWSAVGAVAAGGGMDYPMPAPAPLHEQQPVQLQDLRLASMLPGLVVLHAGISSPSTLRHLAGALRGHTALEVLHVCISGAGLLVGGWQGGGLISGLPALRELRFTCNFEDCGQQEELSHLLADVAGCQNLQVLAVAPPAQLGMQRLLSALHGGGASPLCTSLQRLILDRWVKPAGDRLGPCPSLTHPARENMHQHHRATAFWHRRSPPQQQPVGGWRLGLQHFVHLTQLQLDATGCEAGCELLKDVASSCSQLRELALSQGRQQEARQGDSSGSSGSAAGGSSRSAYTGFMPADLHVLAAGALASSLHRLVVHSCRARPVVGADVGLLAAGLAQLQELEVEPIMRLNTGLASSRGLLPRDVEELVAHVLQVGGLRVLQGSATWHAQHRVGSGGEAPVWAAVWQGAVAAGERCVVCDLVCLGSQPAPDVLARGLL